MDIEFSTGTTLWAYCESPGIRAMSFFGLPEMLRERMSGFACKPLADRILEFSLGQPSSQRSLHGIVQLSLLAQPANPHVVVCMGCHQLKKYFHAFVSIPKL